MASGVLTRIQNNQITDNTINAQYKIATGTITGNLFSSSITLNSNVTILGNLSISGNTSTLNSVNTYINDPIVVFNSQRNKIFLMENTKDYNIVDDFFGLEKSKRLAEFDAKYLYNTSSLIAFRFKQ